MGREYRLHCSLVRACVLVVGVLGLSGVASADPPRVGFANAARSAKGAQTVIESLRMGVANEGFRPLSAGTLRSALEDPFVLETLGTLDDAVTALDRAKDSYASFEYGPALGHLQKADDILRELPTNARVIEVIADRYLLAGLVFAGRGADSQAAESFRVVQRLAPDRKSLDAGTYRPTIVKLYKKALAAKLATVDIEVATDPPGAQVWIDGKATGAAPIKLTVARGLHRVAANADGHRPLAKMIDVAADPPPIELVLRRPSVEKRIHALRHELATGPADDAAAWKTGAGQLSALSGMELMVIVRNAGEGVFEAAIFHNKSGELGRWIPVPSSKFYTAINPRPERRPEVTPRSRQVPAGALDASVDTGKDDESWYSTWWGRSLIVGGAAVAVGAVVFAVTRDSSDNSVGIGDWCFGAECGL